MVLETYYVGITTEVVLSGLLGVNTVVCGQDGVATLHRCVADLIKVHTCTA